MYLPSVCAGCTGNAKALLLAAGNVRAALVNVGVVFIGEAGEEDAKAQLTPMNFEPEAEEAISLLVPKYISSILYGAFVEAVASENGARMQAMDSATSNAEEMIDDLELKYNRARQGAITQELTEIIAGAEAIG